MQKHTSARDWTRNQPGRLKCPVRQTTIRTWKRPVEHDGQKQHVGTYCRGKHSYLHIPNNRSPSPETKHDLREVLLLLLLLLLPLLLAL